VILIALCAPAAAAPPSDERILIAVGANVGAGSDDPLRYAEADARRFRDLLVELGGVRPDRVQLLLEPSPQKVLQAIAEARGRAGEIERAGRHATLFFYYSGHGDEEALHLPQGALPLLDLRRELAAVPSHLRISVLDSCRTGGRLKGITRGSQVEIVTTPEGPHGGIELRSSADGEAAQES